MTTAFTVDTVTALKALNVLALPTNARMTVVTPGTGLPPCWYTLIPSTLTELQPLIVRPNAYTTRLWVAQAGAFGVFTYAPNVVPPFVGYFWVNSGVSPRTIFVSTGTSSTSDWKQI
ncbi:hypothetical protein [Allocoleopsis sp.]|uniref:hypothetical protein n=1 Tax=Allocoleopsis sp. TaxID=3088169 RepID=UPI002FD3C08B